MNQLTLIERTTKKSTQGITILNMAGKGMRTHQIAQQLNISSHTVDTHKRNIIRKFEATN